MNYTNGGNAGGGVPMLTPASHQAELNYIYGMVEELSKKLADNRRVTEDIVNGLGRVRNRARAQGLGNGQVIEAAADDINGTPTWKKGQGFGPVAVNGGGKLSILSSIRSRTKHRRPYLHSLRIS